MNHLALFNGIGGFQLAAKWMGWNNVASVEIDGFCNQVTQYHFPECKQHEDIKEFDGTKYRGAIDIISGGFPCQPYSQAGKRLGKEDDRHLWPEMLRVIREVAPSWVVGENVRGLISWNGGLVFDEVQADLEAEGYEVLPFLLPACAVNAPHRRDRIWFIAYSEGISCRNEPRNEKQGAQKIPGQRLNEFKPTPNADINGQQRSNSKNEKHTSERWQYAQCDFEQGTRQRDATDTSCKGLQKRFCGEQPGISEKKTTFKGRESERALSTITKWQNFPTQSPICSGDDGISDGLDFEAVWQGIKPRKPYITFAKWRNESIKAYGNAIVPQVAYEIFKVINSVYGRTE